jgi:predicted dehydrogenase
MTGSGFIADWHLKAFAKNPHAQIVAMGNDLYGSSDEQHTKFELLKERCKIPGISAYQSFEKMASDPSINALIVGSITAQHYGQIRTAIKNKKHLLVEKPVVIHPEQIDEIRNLAIENQVKIFPAHNFVYRNAVIKAKALLEQGKLGTIIHASFISSHTISEFHATGWRSKNELSSGGALIDSGHHLIYQALYLLGKPCKISSFNSKMVLHNFDDEDTAQVSLQYPDGSLAVIMQSWASGHADKMNGIRIIGTLGSLEISDNLYLNNGRIKAETSYQHSFECQADAFTRYLMFDEKPLSTLDDAALTLRITQAAYRSAKTHQIINI